MKRSTNKAKPDHLNKSAKAIRDHMNLHILLLSTQLKRMVARLCFGNHQVLNEPLEKEVKIEISSQNAKSPRSQKELTSPDILRGNYVAWML